MDKVKLPDNHVGQNSKTLDEVIESLTAIREKAGRGDILVSIYMEPLVNGETVQLEDSLCEVAAAESYREGNYIGISSVHFLGRSFN